MSVNFVNESETSSRNYYIVGDIGRAEGIDISKAAIQMKLSP